MAPLRLLLQSLLRKYETYLYVIIVFVTPFIIEPCLALYEDQVGKFDWRQQYIGAVRFAHFDYNSSSRRIIVATEQNVLAALNPTTSHIVWRQLLEPGTIGTIYALGGSSAEIITVTGLEALMRSWDPATGRLNWETSLTVVRDDQPQRVDATFYSINGKQQIVTVVEASFAAFVRVTRYSFRSGKPLSSIRVAAPWLKKATSCRIVSSAHFVCIGEETVHSLLLDKATAFVSTATSKLNIASDVRASIVSLIPNDAAANKFNLFAIQLGADKFVLLRVHAHSTAAIEENAFEVIHTFDKTSHVFATPVEDEEVLVFAASSSPHAHEFDVRVFSLLSKTYVNDVEIPLEYPEHHGHPEQFFAHSLPKRDGGYSYRLLVQTEAHSLVFLQYPGKLVWAREEALASIVSIEMVDLPVSESDAQVEEQFDNANANIMMMFGKRLVTQFLQLQGFLTNLAIGMHSDVTGAVVPSQKTKLVRDEFNVHKMAVLVTSVGKIFGMDSLTGVIHWQRLVRQLAPHENEGARSTEHTLPLHVLRTTAHYPHPPQCAILGLDKMSQKSILFVFDPITGQSMHDDDRGGGGIVRFDCRIIQLMQLPQHNADFQRGLVLLDEQHKVHVYPKSTLDVASSLSHVLYMFTAHVDKGELHGFSLRFSSSGKELVAGPVWSLAFPVSQHTITNVVLKRSVEHVHSQGRVMSDRSVLYKYLNPNLAVITTEGYNSVQKSTSISLYLVDVVSGHIIFSAVHRKARGPVHIVHSENWVVYVLYSEKYRRMEASVLEMYEGKVQSNTTAFSSMLPPPRPMVEQQSYVFPASIDALSVTVTDKGITSKHLLFALPMGGIVEIPKALLDPRRSLFPSQELREEGVIPYVPELPLPTENIINYNRSVYRVRGIYTAPTGLESTSLVFVYGLDVFYTRVTPSRTFDILKEDFDHWLIVAVLSALIVASYVSKVLAAKKALKQAWK